MAAFDLTGKHAPYLNTHLVIPLYEFLDLKKFYSDKSLKEAKLSLLNKTNMVDFAKEIHEGLNPNSDMTEFDVRRGDVVADMKQLKIRFAPIMRLLADKDVQTQITVARDYKSLIAYLESEHDFHTDMIEVLYKNAKFTYECGNYEHASDYLFFYRHLVAPSEKTYLECLWGKFACEILLQNWDDALDDLNRLKGHLEGDAITSSPLQCLQQRTWIIHWSLFVFFNYSKGKELMVEMFLYQNQYLNAIQTTCPHILRYLAAAIVVNKSRRQPALRDLVKVIQQEAYTYSDPITEFLKSLYVDFDFSAAQEKLKKCVDVLDNDFFLVACQQEFIDNARLMIFELFCRIHQCIQIDMLAEKLDMSYDDAERWIVDLIRQAKLDAKIDSQLGHVIMGTQAVSPYQQLIDKTNNLSFRTQMIATNVEKKIQAARNG